MTYRETQRYPVRDVIFIVGLVSALLVLAIVQLFMGKSITVTQAILAGVIGLGLIGVVWYVWHVRLTLKFGEKNLKLRYGPLNIEKYKVKWKNVQDIELMRLPAFYKWRGWDVHYSTGNKWYNLNGRAAVKITLQNGEVILIGCKELEDIEEVLNKNEKTKDLVHRTA